MFSQKSSVLINQQVGQQVRHASKKAGKGPRNQTTSMRSNLRRFLGPRNFKGFHLKNPFFFSPANKTTNYISQYAIRGDTRDSKGVNWQKVFENRSPANREVSHLTPFATNPHTKTALAVPGAIKARIYEDITVNKVSPQETSFKYGISVPRVEAIIELETIRRKWQSEVSFKSLFQSPLLYFKDFPFKMMSYEKNSISL